MTTTIPATITVIHSISRHSIGDASASDAAWQETVRTACETEIETELARLYPDADVTVFVEIVGQDSILVDADSDDLDADVTVFVEIVGQDSILVDADSDDLDAIREQVRQASNRGFDRACG